MNAPAAAQGGEIRALGLGLYTVLAWSTVASAFKLSLRHGDVWTLVFLASLTSALVLAALLAMQGRWRELAHWERADGLGLANPTAYYLVLLAAYDRLAASQALAVNYTWVLALALLSVFFLRQPFSWRLGLGLASGYAGVCLVAAGKPENPLQGASFTGLALAFASTWIWAGYWIFNTRRSSDTLPGLARQFLAGAAASGLLWAIFSRRFSLPAAAGAAYLGVMEMGLSFYTWLSALRSTRHAARLSALAFLSPVLSLIWISQVLHEPIGPLELSGMALVLAGVILAQANSARTTPPPQR